MLAGFRAARFGRFLEARAWQITLMELDRRDIRERFTETLLRCTAVCRAPDVVSSGVVLA